MEKTFYITTPLYYVNSVPHIGHSYTQVAADTIARFMKQRGRKVYFITGTDEHGQKVAQAAARQNLQPKEFADKIADKFKDVWKGLSIDYDFFIRTTDQRHVKAVQAALSALYEKGDLYEGAYSGWYCTPCETFWTKLQAAGGVCPDCRRQMSEISETNIFFKLSKYQGWLKEHIKTHPDFIKPKFRESEVLNNLTNPLPDLCVTRPRERLSWGIDVPFAKGHVTYVWFDALLNYISSAGWPDDKKAFEALWPADVHLMAKDILRPHAIYWPIMLKALDIAPPKTVFAHGWWVLAGEKISKSRGEVIDPLELTAKYGVDAYRYFLLREAQFGQDGAYSEEALIARVNSDLANDIGNLLNRTLTMIEKYFAGAIPGPADLRPQDAALKECALSLADGIDKAMVDFNFCAYLEAVISVVSRANKYIEDSAPWQLWKDRRIDELSSMLYCLAEVLRIVAAAVYPVMPAAAENMRRQLGLGPDGLGDIKRWGLSRPGAKINKGKPLFPRIAKEPK